MAVRTIEARAVISAQDKTAGVFAGVAARLKALSRAATGTTASVGSAQAVAARAHASQRAQAAANAAGAISARNRARTDALLSRGGIGAGGLGLGVGAGALTVGGVAIGAAKSVTAFADAERKMTRIGITANATREEMQATMAQAQSLAKETAQPFDQIVEGMSALAAQGKSLKETRELIPSIARTAQAAGAEVVDIAKTADAVSSHLGVTSKEMQTAFDLMADGGKRGSFELKDMARYLPSLLPAAKALGVQGTKGLTDIVALMQMVRKSSGTSEEAAASMSDIMQKMEIEETTKKFKKFGVDSTAAFAKARKEGRNVFDVLEELLQQATKGDMSKLPQLFGDKEALRFARSLMQDAGRWRTEAAEMMRTAPGTVMKDMKVVLADTKAPIDQLSESFAGAARSIGSLIATGTPLTDMLNRIGNGAENLSKALKEVKYPPITNPPDDLYKTLGVIPGVPSGPGKATIDEMARRHGKAQERDQKLEGGGQSYGGVAFGMGLDFGKKGGDAGKRISGTYRNSPYAWNAGFDANAPLPPAKPGFVGGAVPASTTEAINAAIRGTTVSDEAKRGPLSRLPTIAPPARDVGPAAGGKVEAVVTAPVTAQLTGSAEVTGKAEVAVTVTVDDSGRAQAMARTVAAMKGTLRSIASNGPGSAGDSHSHAAPGGLGASQ